MLFRNNSNRLTDFDYSSGGGYFITICTQNRKNLFGEIIDENMILNDVGKMVQKWWMWLELQYAYIKLDSFIIMPNHLHGIITIISNKKGVSRNAPTEIEESENCKDDSRNTPTEKEELINCRGGSRTAQKIKPLGQIIGAFKTVSTKQINIINRNKIKFWQRGYYDHIIRNEKELLNIREYIQNNPLKWNLDIENRAINQKIELLDYYKNIYDNKL